MSKLSILKEFIEFLGERKKWWLTVEFYQNKRNSTVVVENEFPD